MAQTRSAGHDRGISDKGLAGGTGDFVTRALLLWPRLDRRRLRRIGDEPMKIARLVARRSDLSIETIRAMVSGTSGAPRHQS